MTDQRVAGRFGARQAGVASGGCHGIFAMPQLPQTLTIAGPVLTSPLLSTSPFLSLGRMVQGPVPGVSATPTFLPIPGTAASADVSGGHQAAQFAPKAVPNRPTAKAGGIGAAQPDRATVADIFTTASKLNQIGAFDMPGYSFQARFAPLVRSGAKTTTIRGRFAEAGTIAYLYTGQRTAKCERLGVHTITSCIPIVLGWRNGCPSVQLRGKLLTQAMTLALAVSEGFATGREMMEWFQSTYKQCVPNGEGTTVYVGYLISWKAKP